MKKLTPLAITVLLTACITNPLQEYSGISILTLGEERGWETAAMHGKEINILRFLPVELQRGNLHEVAFIGENDRMMAVRWTEVSSTHDAMIMLRENLFSQFSRAVHSIVDERVYTENGSTIDIMAFTDPALFPEHIIIAAIGSMLYEFHVPEGRSNTAMELLIDIADVP